MDVPVALRTDFHYEIIFITPISVWPIIYVMDFRGSVTSTVSAVVGLCPLLSHAIPPLLRLLHAIWLVPPFWRDRFFLMLLSCCTL